METKKYKQKKYANDIRVRPMKLRLYPDNILRQCASSVTTFDRSLKAFLRDMVSFMKKHNGVGLAAPQVGVSSRIIVADAGGGPLGLINPRIVGREGADNMEEGCLSLPGVFIDVERNFRIEVKGQNYSGREVEFEAEGLMARVLQHEIDHLSGRLICDYEENN